MSEGSGKMSVEGRTRRVHMNAAHESLLYGVATLIAEGTNKRVTQNVTHVDKQTSRAQALSLNHHPGAFDIRQ